MYGTVRTVVWEDEGGDSLSYPILRDRRKCIPEGILSAFHFSPRKLPAEWKRFPEPGNKISSTGLKLALMRICL